jgi:hypothetical protein
MTNTMTGAALALGGLLLVGCAEELDTLPEGVDPVDAELLAEVVRDNGNRVELYEHAPGQWFYLESGLAPSVAGEFTTLQGFYQAAAPGRAVPATVVEAQLRADGLQLANGGGLEEISDHHDVVAVPQESPRLASACELATFIINQCKGGDDQQWCKTSWSNGFYATNTSANYMAHAVCALDGNITLRLFVDSALTGSWTVNQGNFKKIGKVQQPIYLPVPPFYLSNRFGFITDIVNASGDTFRTAGYSGDH